MEFLDNPSAPFEKLDFILKKDNNIKILSYQHYIKIENELNFSKADLANLTIWANGPADVNRGVTPFDCQTGAVFFNPTCQPR